MRWNESVKIIQYSSAAVSVFLNISLTYLIVFKSPKQLGSYKYLMIYLAWFEIAYSIVDMIVSPRIYIHGSAYMIYVNQNNNIFEKETIRFLMEIWAAFYGFSIGIFVVPFYYRYLVAVGSKILKTLKDWRILLWFSFPLVYGVLWFFIAKFLVHQTAEMDEYLRTPLLSDLDMDMDDIVSFGAYFYQKTGKKEYIIDWKSICGVSIAWLTVGISIISIFYFGVQCYKQMNSLMKTASKMQGLQNQLFFALLVETIIPLVLMHIPVSLLFLLTFYEIDVGMMADTLSVTTALFPAIDPLPTMFIIQNYRMTIFSMFGFTKTPPRTSMGINLSNLNKI